MTLHRGRHVWFATLFALLVIAPTLKAQDLTKAAESLRLVPGDAASYSVMLRNREQIEIIAKSKAWARFRALPLVQMIQQKFEEEWNAGNLAMVRQWYEKGEGHALLRLLGDMFGDEVFFYGGKNSIEFLQLMQDIQTANQLAPLMQLLQPGNLQPPGSPETRMRAILQALAAEPQRIKIPDCVIGFKLKDTKEAATQLDRLEKIVKTVSENMPDLQKRISKGKVNGGDFLMLRLDGQMVPWDDIPLQLFEENPGEFAPLVKRLKELKLTVSLGLRDNFVLFGIGEDTAALEALGKKAPMSQRPELAPLAKFSERRLSAIAYVSKEAQALNSPSRENVEEGFRWITNQLREAGLPKEKLDKINTDLKALAKDIMRGAPEPGPMLTFSFLTDKGVETYVHDWTKYHDGDGKKPLTLLNHMGGNPLFYYCSRSTYDPKEYETLVKWLKIGYKYFEEWGLPNLPQDAQDQFQKFFKELQPLLARLDKATGKMLLPALADGQTAFVLDARIKSKQWHQALPPLDRELPMLEPALVFGVSDPDLLKKAMSEYRSIANDFFALIAKQAPVPIELKIPEPNVKEVNGGTLYFFPLTGLGLDPQIAPTFGLSKNTAVATISQEHATRLLNKTPPSNGIVKLDQPYVSSFRLDFAGLMDAVAPWADYALQLAHAEENVIEHVQAILQILKVMRGVTGVTYREGDALVSHAETIFRDLER